MVLAPIRQLFLLEMIVTTISLQGIDFEICLSNIQVQ